MKNKTYLLTTAGTLGASKYENHVMLNTVKSLLKMDALSYDELVLHHENKVCPVLIIDVTDLEDLEPLKHELLEVLGMENLLTFNEKWKATEVNHKGIIVPADLTMYDVTDVGTDDDLPFFVNETTGRRFKIAK